MSKLCIASLLKYIADPSCQLSSIFIAHYRSIISFIAYEEYIDKKGCHIIYLEKQYLTNSIKNTMLIVHGTKFVNGLYNRFLHSQHKLIGKGGTIIAPG